MDAATSPDPISEPKAYQDHLLSLLGADDPRQLQAGPPERVASVGRRRGGAPGTLARNRRSGR